MPSNKSFALECHANKSHALECRATNPTHWDAAQQILRAGMPRNKSYVLECRATKSYALKCRATNPTRWNAAQQILRAEMPRNKILRAEMPRKQILRAGMLRNKILRAEMPRNKSYAYVCPANFPKEHMQDGDLAQRIQKIYVFLYYLDVDRDGSAVLQLNNITMDVGVVVLGQGPLEEAGPPFLQDPPYVLRFSVVQRQATEVWSVEVSHRHFPKGDSFSLRHSSLFFGQWDRYHAVSRGWTESDMLYVVFTKGSYFIRLLCTHPGITNTSGQTRDELLSSWDWS